MTKVAEKPIEQVGALYLLEQATKCRHLAHDIANKAAKLALVAMAEEFEAKALDVG
jgi:hypothetical protein